VSKIQWTDRTDNPIYLKREDGSNGGHWCKKVSPGCAGCYAEAQNQKGFFPWASKLKYSGEMPDNLHFDVDMVAGWGRAKKPQRRFVCSMTDLFGEWVSRDWQFHVFLAAANAPTQTIQVLTKRPEVALESAKAWCRMMGTDKWLPPNLWLGVSVEDQQRADERRPYAAELSKYCDVVFCSYEPALEKVRWHGWEFLKWLIIGGESGPAARPFNLDWAISTLLWCRRNDVTPFMKQVGQNPIMDYYWWLSWCEAEGYDPNEAELIDWNYQWGQPKIGTLCKVPGTGKGGDPEQWPADIRVREFPK
jgi:protein gp37